MQGELKVLDLKSAYLQIHISEDLWKYQIVLYKGIHYALTCLGFGLSCAPRIMTSILRKVLSLNDRVCRGTDNYINDIVVLESIVGVGEVRAHLTKYGLETKEPEDLDGGRLLGIALNKDSSRCLHMSRRTPLVDIDLNMTGLTKRGCFYYVAGWLVTTL